MVSDNMLHCRVPTTEDHSDPLLFSRSSSLSERPRKRDLRDTQSQSLRRNIVGNSRRRADFLDKEHLPSTMKTDSPRHASGRSISCAPPSRNNTESTKVQRWAGLTRSVCNWDGLRKDPELWVQDGDCRVHLYALGASRRGPSFCVPLRALRQKNCDRMLESYYAQIVYRDLDGPHEPQQLRSFKSSPRAALIELYIPAPEDASREDVFNWHITTRNFFAYVLGKPLVGRHMGQAFAHLFERMEVFRSGQFDNHQEFLTYAENQGYRDLVECTDYALASLYYAEKYKLRDVWIDAFTHCVGMRDDTKLSPEYTLISRLTKALITRACLEVDIHLDGAKKALGTFLQDDLSAAYLGLPQGARRHLVRFQAFLHDFYVDKFGSWPPRGSASHFPKAVYKSMFNDFKNLYDLLADTQSSNDIALQRPASGGICVLQNLAHFDQRHKFVSQPHPLPLLPSVSSYSKPTRTLSSASYHRRACDNSASLALTTNSLGAEASNLKIIQAYMQFERTHTTASAQREEKVSAIDARKIRWFLIYGTLQYLTSALRAPDAVRDVESPEYPLCCLTVGQSSCDVPIPGTTNDRPKKALCISIQPDCQREDYISSGTSNRRGRVEYYAPAKPQAPVRQNSIRSSKSLATLAIKGPSKKSSTLRPASYCAIIVHGYGDGVNQVTAHDSVPSAITHKNADEEFSWSQPQSLSLPANTATPSIEPRGHTRNRTPLLHTFQLDHLAVATPVTESTNDIMSRSDSTSSMDSSAWTDGGSAASSKSSADGERQHTYTKSTAEHSGLLGGLISVDGTRVSLDVPEDRLSIASLLQADLHPLLRKSPDQQNEFIFDFSAQKLEAATYVPTVDAIGMAISAPPSPLTSEWRADELEDEDETSAPGPDIARRRKNRNSDIFSSIITAPTELRGLYNTAVKRLEGPPDIKSYQYGDLCDGSKSVTQSPTTIKTSDTTNMSPPRNRIRNDDRKMEKRMSFLWRR